MQQRDQRHGHAAGDIRDDARAPVAHPVDQRAAQESRDHHRQDGEEAGDARLRRAAGRLQNEPGNGDRRQHVADQRDRIGDEECDDGKSFHGRQRS